MLYNVTGAILCQPTLHATCTMKRAIQQLPQQEQKTSCKIDIANKAQRPTENRGRHSNAQLRSSSSMLQRESSSVEPQL